MARTLYFTQITDDRFDKDIRTLLEERVERLKELLRIDGVEVAVFPITDIHFDEHAMYWEDGTFAYTIPGSNQCRCRFEVKKSTRKVSWNEIYRIVNSVNAVPYAFC